MLNSSLWLQVCCRYQQPESQAHWDPARLSRSSRSVVFFALNTKTHIYNLVLSFRRKLLSKRNHNLLARMSCSCGPACSLSSLYLRCLRHLLQPAVTSREPDISHRPTPSILARAAWTALRLWSASEPACWSASACASLRVAPLAFADVVALSEPSTFG